MNIKNFKFSNKYHVVTYTVEFPYDYIHITVTSKGYTDLIVENFYGEYKDIAKSLNTLNKAFETLLYFQENA